MHVLKCQASNRELSLKAAGQGEVSGQTAVRPRYNGESGWPSWQGRTKEAPSAAPLGTRRPTSPLLTHSLRLCRVLV